MFDADLPWTFWFRVSLTGLGAGLSAALLMTLLRLVQHVVWGHRGGETFLDAVQRNVSLTRILVLLGTGAAVAIVLPLIGRLPRGAGGGLEAVIWFRDGRLPLLRNGAKAIFSIVIVALGASLGREAAPKLVGAVIGGEVARHGKLGAPQRRLLAACGAGAGLAAVYNVPLGGALFALEVLLGTLSLSLVGPALLATVCATMVYWQFFPDEPVYRLPSMMPTTSLIVFAIASAPIAGLAGALFVELVDLAGRARLEGWRAPAVAVAVFGGLGLLAVPFPQLLGNGKDIVELAALDRIALPMLAALMLLKPLATAACLGTGAPGGLFTPTLACGTLLGAVLGHLWVSLWPDPTVGAYPIVFATAVLAATMKGPICALVLVLELTRLDGLLLPMSICTAIALPITRRLDRRSTYTARLRRPPSTVPNAVPASLSASELAVVLATSIEGSVDVVGEAGDIIGTVTTASLRSPLAGLALLPIVTAGDIVDADTDRGAGDVATTDRRRRR